jgi:hypothetical protein
VRRHLRELGLHLFVFVHFLFDAPVLGEHFLALRFHILLLLQKGLKLLLALLFLEPAFPFLLFLPLLLLELTFLLALKHLLLPFELVTDAFLLFRQGHNIVGEYKSPAEFSLGLGINHDLLILPVLEYFVLGDCDGEVVLFLLLTGREGQADNIHQLDSCLGNTVLQLPHIQVLELLDHLVVVKCVVMHIQDSFA